MPEIAPSLTQILAAATAWLALTWAGAAAARRLWRNYRRRPQVWRRRCRLLPQTLWTMRDLAMMLALIALAVPVSERLARHLAAPAWNIAIRVLVLHGGGILLAALLWRRQARRGAPRRRAIRRSVRWGIFFYLASLPFVMAAGLLNQMLLRLAGQTPALQDAALELLAAENWPARLALILAAGLTAPVFEELLFRGMALPLAARGAGAVPAAIGTAAAFALIHLHAAAVLPLFMLAVFLSIAYIYTRSLSAVIAMHALFNLVNIALLLLLF